MSCQGGVLDKILANVLQKQITKVLPSAISSLTSSIKVGVKANGKVNGPIGTYATYSINATNLTNFKITNPIFTIGCLEIQKDLSLLLSGSGSFLVFGTINFLGTGGKTGIGPISVSENVDGNASFSATIKFTINMKAGKNKNCYKVIKLDKSDLNINIAKWDISNVKITKASSTDQICRDFGSVVCEANYVTQMTGCEAMRACEASCCGPIHFCSCDKCRNSYKKCDAGAAKNKDECNNNCKTAMNSLTGSIAMGIKDILSENVIQEVALPALKNALIPVIINLIKSQEFCPPPKSEFTQNFVTTSNKPCSQTLLWLVIVLLVISILAIAFCGVLLYKRK